MEKIIDYFIAGDMNALLLVVVIFVSSWIYKEYYKTSVERNLQEEQRNHDALDTYLSALSEIENKNEQIDSSKLYHVIAYYPQIIWKDYLQAVEKKDYILIKELLKKEMTTCKVRQYDRVSESLSIMSNIENFVKRHQIIEWVTAVLATCFFWIAVVFFIAIGNMVKEFGSVNGYIALLSFVLSVFALFASFIIIDLILESFRRQKSNQIKKQIIKSILITVGTFVISFLSFHLTANRSISVWFYLILSIGIVVGNILWLKFFAPKVRDN